MSFLDHYPVDWTDPGPQRLRDLLVLAYSRPDEAMEVAKDAGIAPGTFPVRDNMRITWRALIEEMARQGKLRALIAVAAQDANVVAYRPQFLSIMSGEVVVSTLGREPAGGGWHGRGNEREVVEQLHLQRLILKRSRLIDIAIARQVTQVSQSVAKLDLVFKNQRAYGTGFLIQPDLILTNFHNLLHEQHGAPSGVTADFDFEPGVTANRLVRRGDPVPVAGDKTHDWAVIRLDYAVDRPPIPLGTPYQVAIDDPIVIIQHPLGAFKQFCLDFMSIQHIDEKVIQYLADTQDGSSGSPVFSIKMHLIALHHAEADHTVAINGRKGLIWRNEGIRVEQIMRGLRLNGIAYETNNY